MTLWKVLESLFLVGTEVGFRESINGGDCSNVESEGHENGGVLERRELSDGWASVEIKNNM